MPQKQPCTPLENELLTSDLQRAHAELHRMTSRNNFWAPRRAHMTARPGCAYASAPAWHQQRKRASETHEIASRVPAARASGKGRPGSGARGRSPCGGAWRSEAPLRARPRPGRLRGRTAQQPRPAPDELRAAPAALTRARSLPARLLLLHSHGLN